MNSQIETLRHKMSKQQKAYAKNRRMYPEVARVNRRNVMLIEKQIRTLKSQGKM